MNVTLQAILTLVAVSVAHFGSFAAMICEPVRRAMPGPLQYSVGIICVIAGLLLLAALLPAPVPVPFKLLSVLCAINSIVILYFLIISYWGGDYYRTKKWLSDEWKDPVFIEPEQLRALIVEQIGASTTRDVNIADAMVEMYTQEWRPNSYPPPLPLCFDSSSDEERNKFWDDITAINLHRDKAAPMAEFYVEAAWTIKALLRSLPDTSAPGRLQVEVTDVFDNMGWLIAELARIFYTPKALELDLAKKFRTRFDINRGAVGLSYLSSAEYSVNRYLDPGNFPGPRENIVQSYLGGTSLERLFK